MARRKIGAGLTSLTLPVSVKDTSSTTGGGLSGLTSATSGLVCEYRRQGQSSWTAVSLSAGTLGTWSSGGFVADGSQAGDYELGLPDAAVASGARWVIVRLRGATNMLPVRVEIELDAVNYQSATAFITAINSLAPPTNWNLFSLDSSGRTLLQPTQTGVTIPTVTSLTNAPTDSAGVGTLLTRVPNTLPSFPANFATFAIDASGRVDIGRILGTASAGAAGYIALDTAQALPASPTAGTTGAGLFYGAQQIGRTGTAQAGGANTITLDAGASASDNVYASHEVKITGGTGSGQFATITAYNGTTKVATITRPGTGNWSTNPDATSLFLILPVPYVTVQASLDKTAYSLSSPQTFNLTGNVTGNLSGSVGSVTGAVGSVSGAVGSVTGAVGSVTGNVGGNVAGSVGSVAAAVTAGTVSDKTGYSLTTAEHTSISGTDVPAGLTAQGYTTTRAGYLDTLNGLVAAIWGNVTRSLTTFGTLTTDAASAVWAAGTRTLSAFGFTVAASNLPSDYARNNVAPGWYTAPDNADVATALGDLVALLARTDPTTALTTLQTAATAIKAKTDMLTFTGSNVNAVISGDATTTLYGDAGAITFTYTTFDVGGSTPLPGAAVYVSADSAGTQRSQSKITDSLGRVTFQLDAGTVYFWRSRADRVFSDNPQTEVVS